MAEELTVGFRFYPTEDELIAFYLRNQLEGRNYDSMHFVIPVLDIFELEPCHLPNFAGEGCRGDTEQWFFFVPRQEREARGGRPSRTTGSGYWKATGSPGLVFSRDNRIIGVKKTMVFYTGKAPTGRKTIWKMNEYKAVDDTVNDSTIKLRHEFSLCRVYITSGNSRAFDRRPVGGFQRDQRLLTSDVAVAETSTPVRVVSSPEISISRGEHADFSVNTDLVDGLTEPIWEWEQLSRP